MPYSKPCQYSTKLIEKLKSLDVANPLDVALISKAICWAKKYHNGQMRKSGEPFCRVSHQRVILTEYFSNGSSPNYA